MKVLILHQHFNTPQKGGAIRSYYLAKALVEQNMQVVVITGHSLPHETVENVEGIHVHYLPVDYDNRFGFYKRSLSFLKYIHLAVRAARAVADADVCYAISVPLTIGLAAMRIQRRFKIPFIFEVGDLWPDAPIQMGFVRNYFFRKALYALERKIYTRASAVVALSVAIQEAILKKVPGKTVHVLPNMADTAYYQPEAKRPALEQRFGVSQKFVVSYIGALGVANGLAYFLACAQASQRAALPVHFLLCGDGAQRDFLQEASAKLGLNNLTLLPFQNRDGVRQVLNVTDASFVCYQNVPVLETGSPNKYFDGLAAGKLIIVNVNGWMREEIERNGCGVYVDPRAPEDFVRRLRPYLADAQRLSTSRQAARTLAEEKYARKTTGEHFANIIRSAPRR